MNQVDYFLNENERLLDLIFINEDLIFNISVPDYPLFQIPLHHLPILFEAGSLNFSNSCSLDRKFFDFKNADYAGLNNSQLSVDWSARFSNLNLSDKYSCFIRQR